MKQFHLLQIRQFRHKTSINVNLSQKLYITMFTIIVPTNLVSFTKFVKLLFLKNWNEVS